MEPELLSEYDHCSNLALTEAFTDLAHDLPEFLKKYREWNYGTFEIGNPQSVISVNTISNENGFTIGDTWVPPRLMFAFWKEAPQPLRKGVVLRDADLDVPDAFMTEFMEKHPNLNVKTTRIKEGWAIAYELSWKGSRPRKRAKKK